MRNSNIIIMSVSLMDLITALLILFDSHPLLVARLGIFYKIFPHPAYGALLMLIAVLLAFYGLTIAIPLRRFLLFIPQQLFLLMTTGSAVDYIAMQHYADGIMRSWQFILQDQLPTIILTLVYFFAIVDLRKRKYVQY